MKKLTLDEDKLICDLLRYHVNEDMTQHILKTIGKDNWSRTILDNAQSNLTDKHERYF